MFLVFSSIRFLDYFDHDDFQYTDQLFSTTVILWIVRYGEVMMNLEDIAKPFDHFVDIV
jgi:hypothetical protein